MRFVFLAAILYGLCMLAASPAQADTVLVGDSLGWGTAPYLNARASVLPGIGSDTAIDRLKVLDTAQTDAIVFDAGTNDAKLQTLGRSIWQLLEIAHGRPVVLLTTSGYIGATPAEVSRLTNRKNRMLRRIDGGNIHVIRWRKYALERGLLADGVHATPEGYRERARLIDRELDEGGDR